MKDDPVIALATTFGPILKAAFPNEHSVTRFQVANALAEAALALSLQDELVEAASRLIDDVRSRHPGEELHCPHMRALASLLTRIKSERDGI